ncbi:conserved Plasmodium protein, unknown function [Plasmodium ovale wallikeri]|nr:conserved Plasmodium protein, unknown function [Plasmodium ovale wallikeri]SBT32101.1 conserved Plasmodium protein, unknown function [Plasmodium ovale wallikeri]
MMNRDTKKVEYIIEGDNKMINNFETTLSNEVIRIHAVGSNILRASYLLQDVVNYYSSFLKDIQNTSSMGKKTSPIDVYSLIDIKVSSKSLFMYDNVISNRYHIKEEFLKDDYDDIINFAKQPYDRNMHTYRERCKERIITGITISLKKNDINL